MPRRPKSLTPDQPVKPPRKKWGKYSYYREKPVDAASATAPDGSAPPSTPPGDGTANLPSAEAEIPQGLVPFGTVVVPRGQHPPIENLTPGLRKRIAAILSLRALGKSDEDIAKELGIARQTLSNNLHVAGKHGLFTQGNPNDRLAFEIPDKLVRNLSEFLDHPDDELRKDVTIEGLKGTGMFKSHQAVKSEGGQAISAVMVQVVMPEGIKQEVIEGSMGGVEGTFEVVDDKPTG